MSFSLIITAVIFIWLAILTFLLWRLIVHYSKITKGITKKDLRSILDKLLGDLDRESKHLDDLVKITQGIKKDNLYNIQKIGLVRFNPFAETGGDQSFCLAVLDGDDSGLVISTLHSRDVTRIYAKPIKRGKAAGYDLSFEEKQAIKNAKRTK